MKLLAISFNAALIIVLGVGVAKYGLPKANELEEVLLFLLMILTPAINLLHILFWRGESVK
jgi:hypothetical protein